MGAGWGLGKHIESGTILGQSVYLGRLLLACTMVDYGSSFRVVGRDMVIRIGRLLVLIDTNTPSGIMFSF
jgi:hypothetical protein